MLNWLSGEKLVTLLEIQIVELFDMVIGGLQPHDKVRNPTPPPDVAERLRNLEELEKKLRNLRSLKKAWESRSLKKRYLSPKLVEDEMKNMEPVEKGIKDLKNKLSKKGLYSWSKFELPTSEEEAGPIFEILANSLYRITEVEQFIKFPSETKREENIFSTSYKNTIDPKLINLITKASPEIEAIYKPMKEKVGFSGVGEERELSLQKVASEEFRKNRNNYNYIKEEYLEDLNVFALNGGQAPRDFKGTILQRIVKDHCHVRIGAQKLYKIYKSIT